MCLRRSRGRNRAFTLTEVSVVIICLAAMALIVAPSVMNRLFHRGCRAQRTQCVNNLKNIGLAARIFATDNNGSYPWQISLTNGGTREFHTTTGAVHPGVTGRTLAASDSNGSVWAHLVALSNELNTPKIVACPHDKRAVAPNFASILTNAAYQENQAVSYFLGLDAREDQPQTIMAGDRNVAVDDTRLAAGYHAIPLDRPVSFTREIHNHAGNILLGDGSVQQVTSGRFHDQVRDSASALTRTNELFLIP